MKKSIIGALLLTAVIAHAQEGRVGINTDQPNATLDIQPNATNLAGTTNEGIIAPKLTKQRVADITYSSPQDIKNAEGTLVYITETDYTQENSTNPTEKDKRVAKIDEKGYYFYNGTEWVKSGNNAEWVYDDTTKQINLKRSGHSTGFVNKVYYNEKGGLINIDTETFESPLQANASVINGISGHNKLIANTKNISYIYPDLRVLDKVAVFLDKISGTQDMQILGRAQTVYIENDDTKNHGKIYSSFSNVDINGSGRVEYANASMNEVKVTKGELDTAVGSLSNIWLGGGSIKLAIGSQSRIDVGNTQVNTIIGRDIMLNFIGNTMETIENAVGYDFDTNIEGGKVSIENFYGIRHKGTDNFQTRSNIKNNYGLYLGNINFASEKNYAIYTNAGKVRFGDNVGIGVDTPTQKLEVAGKIKASNVIFTGIPTYADDTTAGAGGLVAGEMYKTSTGELRIKL